MLSLQEILEKELRRYRDEMIFSLQNPVKTRYGTVRSVFIEYDGTVYLDGRDIKKSYLDPKDMNNIECVHLIDSIASESDSSIKEVIINHLKDTE